MMKKKHRKPADILRAIAFEYILDFTLPASAK